jgi:hypothetical protein
VQSWTEHPTLIDNKRHNTSRLSRSPSATTESVPDAEYQKLPLQSFLKCTRIRNETTLNLGFYLTHLLEDHELSVPFAALSSSFGVETSAQPRISHSARF